MLGKFHFDDNMQELMINVNLMKKQVHESMSNKSAWMASCQIAGILRKNETMERKKEQQNLDGNSALSCRATTVKEMDGLLIFKSGIGKQFRG